MNTISENVHPYFFKLKTLSSFQPMSCFKQQKCPLKQNSVIYTKRTILQNQARSTVITISLELKTLYHSFIKNMSWNAVLFWSELAKKVWKSASKWIGNQHDVNASRVAYPQFLRPRSGATNQMESFLLYSVSSFINRVNFITGKVQSRK